MVKPDWSITMHMWPMPEKKKEELPPPPPGVIPLPPDFHGLGRHGKKDRHGRDKGKSKSHGHGMPPPPLGLPPPPSGMPHGPGALGMPPPPQGPPPPPVAAGAMEIPPPPPGGAASPPAHRSSKDKKRKKQDAAGLAVWFAGGPVNRKGSLKYGKESDDRPYRSGAGGVLPTAENGRALRESAPNGRPVVKPSWF